MIAPINPSDEETQGGGGALFARDDNLRSDARMAARMITLGVIGLDQAQKLLRQGLVLASKSAKRGDARGYSACMKIAIELAKLEQTERLKMLDKLAPDQLEVVHREQNRSSIGELVANPDYVEFLRHRTLNEDCDPSAICQIREPGNGKALANGSTHGGAGPGTNGHRNGQE